MICLTLKEKTNSLVQVNKVIDEAYRDLAGVYGINTPRVYAEVYPTNTKKQNLVYVKVSPDFFNGGEASKASMLGLYLPYYKRKDEWTVSWSYTARGEDRRGRCNLHNPLKMKFTLTIQDIPYYSEPPQRKWIPVNLLCVQEQHGPHPCF